MIKRIYYITLICFFTLIFLNSCNKNDNRSKPQVGFYAPDFTLESVNGKVYKLSDFRNKVVFVNVWATWCPPCKQEVPSMVKLYNKLSAKGLVILAISEDNDVSALKKFIQEYNVPFIVLRDTDKKVYNLYKATGVPETHLISKNGIIEKSWIGPFEWTSGEVVNKVKRLMAEE